MERYNNRKFDEVGRIVLPSGLRESLGLASGISVALVQIANLIILQKAENDTSNGGVVCQIDDLGRITPPTELVKKLNWLAGDSIALYHTDDVIILKRA